jgi:predicted deacylase
MRRIMHPPKIPLLDSLTSGTTQRHLVRLPGAALADDEPRPVITITGASAGPTLFVNAGLHGAEYPAIEAVIRLGKMLDPKTISGTVILMPVLNLPAFRSRTPFVCPIDNINPNRVFPGDPNGTYSEQMVHALITQFLAHADAYIDLHGGDIPEDLVPFVICRDGDGEVDIKSKEMAMAFGVPYVLTVSKPVQVAKGSSSYVAAAEKGVPAILAEAGGVGQLQDDAVELLVNGVVRVMRYLRMTRKSEVRISKSETSSKAQRSKEDLRSQTVAAEEDGKLAASPTEKEETPRHREAATVLTAFEWVYAKDAGMWYSRVAAGDVVEKGQQIGTVTDLFGDVLETIVSPVTGIVLFLTINPSVQANGLLMGIGAAGES